MDRAFGYEPKGWGFESLPGYWLVEAERFLVTAKGSLPQSPVLGGVRSRLSADGIPDSGFASLLLGASRPVSRKHAGECGRNSTVECSVANADVGVRFPSPALQEGLRVRVPSSAYVS